LGRRTGLFQFARRSDVAIGLHLGGRAGARLKEFVCRQTVQQLAYEARKPGARTWTVKDPRRAELRETAART
jgi:NADH dehydrogenase